MFNHMPLGILINCFYNLNKSLNYLYVINRIKFNHLIENLQSIAMAKKLTLNRN